MPTRHQSTYATHPDIAPILPQFIARLPATVAQLRQFSTENNPEPLRRLLHQLKGAGQSYGFPPITTLAASLEQSLLSHTPLPSLQPTLTELLTYIENIEGYPS